MKKWKTNIYGIFFLLFLILLPSISALVISGSDGINTYTSDSAQGSIAERGVTSSSGHSGIVFSWGAPLANATNTVDGKTYVVTIGPDFSDPETPAVVEEEEAEVVEGGGVPSSGGGGAGSSSRDTYGLIIGDQLTVLIGGEKHTITIDDVFDERVTVTIDGNERQELIVGETTEIDLDEDGIPDMALTLDAVSELRRVTITVEDLTQKKEDEEEQIEAAQEKEVSALEKITGAIPGLNTEQLKKLREETETRAITISSYILAINLFLAILLGILFVARQVQKQRIYTFFHQQSKEELIQQELQKVQGYASKALQAGIHFQEVKQNLLTAGWHEYEIDEILVNEMLKSDSLNQFQ